MTFPTKIGCNGMPDCDPPDFTFRLISAIGISVLIFILDMIFYQAMGDSFKDPFAKQIPEMLPLIIGTFVGGTLFSELYIYYARRPQTSHKSNELLRSRTSKGAVYGFSMASIIFVPAVFIDYSVLDGINLGNHIVDAVYRLVQFSALGVIVAHILKKP